MSTTSPVPDDTYEHLAAPFDVVFIDRRNGIEIPYLSGEQVASRLNEVLGVHNWSYRILEHGHNEEADEVWALGELAATIAGHMVVRQQFGSQKIKRSRRDKLILNLGDDKKAAGTDAMKKCASLLGIGLYLSRKTQNPDGTARGWNADADAEMDTEQPQRTPRRSVRAPAMPPREPYTNGTSHAAPATKPERDPNEIIKSLEHVLVQRIVSLKAEARERGIEVPETKLPASRAQLIDWGTALRNAIDRDKETKGEVIVTEAAPPESEAVA